MKEPFTIEEQEIMRLITTAHKKFVELKQYHPDDMPDWVRGIHECQNILMRRVVTRDYPKHFIKK